MRVVTLTETGTHAQIDAAVEGAAFGFWPIMWIVINALWIFNMSDATGHFAVLRRAFSDVSNDQRVQVIMVAFCFGALLEALAGFGTPVAICGVMLMGLGLKPVRAAAVALVTLASGAMLYRMKRMQLPTVSESKLPSGTAGADSMHIRGNPKAA